MATGVTEYSKLRGKVLRCIRTFPAFEKVPEEVVQMAVDIVLIVGALRKDEDWEKPTPTKEETHFRDLWLEAARSGDYAELRRAIEAGRMLALSNGQARWGLVRDAAVMSTWGLLSTWKEVRRWRVTKASVPQRLKDGRC